MADGTVKYVTVRDHLAERITRMTAGDQLPTEPTLCQEYGVSRITVRRAVDELIRSGRLIREQGRGTFVTEPLVTHHLRENFANRITGFYRQQTLLGHEVTTRVLGNRITRSPEAARSLGINAADEVVCLERLRYLNGKLHQHVTTYLSAASYPGVLDLDLSEGSLFDFLERSYGAVLARNDLLVRLEHVDDGIAEHLGIPGGEVVLTIDSTVFTADDTPVAFGIARHTPANSQVSFSLRHDAGADSSTPSGA